MKQGRIVVAWTEIGILYKTKGVPFGISSQLFTLKRKLQPFVEHQQEQEIAALEEIGAVNTDMTVNVTDENCKQINDIMREIRETEVEYNEEPTTIKLTDAICEKLGVSGETIDKLDGFVVFEMEGEA